MSTINLGGSGRLSACLDEDQKLLVMINTDEPDVTIWLNREKHIFVRTVSPAVFNESI